VVEGWSGAAPYGTDMWARQRAEQAEKAAAARGCRLGSAKTVALLALGGSVDVAVVWPTPITVPHSVEAVAGPGLIGAAAFAVKSKSETNCVITVTATLAVAAGAVVFAHATW
jgi:hypothetical protein